MLILVVHLSGAGVGGEIAESSGGYFLVWTLITLGVTWRVSAGSWARAGHLTD